MGHTRGQSLKPPERGDARRRALLADGAELGVDGVAVLRAADHHGGGRVRPSQVANDHFHLREERRGVRTPLVQQQDHREAPFLQHALTSEYTRQHATTRDVGAL